MRNAFADELTKLAKEREDLVLLSGDIGNKLFDKYKAQSPERFFNCGVAEANMMSTAAGMALSGLRPVVYTITPFVTSRCLEQIRVDVCYHDLPVIIVGVGSGLGYASLGPTHHACEDIAMLRCLPGMTVLCPADSMEVRALLNRAMEQTGPVYMRIGKKNEPVVHSNVPSLSFGRGFVVSEGTDICILSTGVLLPMALDVRDRLADRGLSIEVVSMHTVKPLDEDMLNSAFSKFSAVATIEEHSLIGGLGSAVAEWLADNKPSHCPLVRIGTADHFLHKSGSPTYARDQFGLNAASIAERIENALQSGQTKSLQH